MRVKTWALARTTRFLLSVMVVSFTASAMTVVSSMFSCGSRSLPLLKQSRRVPLQASSLRHSPPGNYLGALDRATVQQTFDTFTSADSTLTTVRTRPTEGTYP